MTTPETTVLEGILDSSPAGGKSDVTLSESGTPSFPSRKAFNDLSLYSTVDASPFAGGKREEYSALAVPAGTKTTEI